MRSLEQNEKFLAQPRRFPGRRLRRGPFEDRETPEFVSRIAGYLPLA